MDPRALLDSRMRCVRLPKVMCRHEPRVRVKMTCAQRKEWQQLIQVAGLDKGRPFSAPVKPWWRIW